MARSGPWAISERCGEMRHDPAGDPGGERCGPHHRDEGERQGHAPRRHTVAEKAVPETEIEGRHQV